ncbi:helix-turn-helix domain-containing protein [Inquilinus limosus]|uniref:GlxA family transcriptional regulator n=1 Tax=Inquilinus limosus TaxID=171674 RepID=UPI003F18C51A
MRSKPIHVAIWLPASFYSAVAATLVETLELVNALRREPAFSFEFVARAAMAAATSGIAFPAKPEPTAPVDVLVLLAMPGLNVPEMLQALAEESGHARPLIDQARQQGAIIAAHCGAAYFLADAGLLDGRRATISWWLKEDALRRFPKVRWDPSRLLLRHDRIYSCGGGFSGLELASALLRDLGFAKEERIVRKLLVLPPARRFQTPYEFPLEEAAPTAQPLRDRLLELARADLPALDPAMLARTLGLSPRTLARRFAEELQTTPGRWIQDRRLDAARDLLERSDLGIAEICYQVGYQDVASFSRLFSRRIGLSPGEYRRQAR